MVKMDTRIVVVLFFLVFTTAAGLHTVINVLEDLKATTMLQYLRHVHLTLSLEFPGRQHTIFAPSNEAFDALPETTKKLLMSNTTLLKEVLEFHIIPDILMSTDFINDEEIPSLLGPYIRLNVYEKAVTALGSPVSKVDNKASNGVVHVIDRVMYPLPTRTIIQWAAHTSNVSAIATVLEKPDFIEIVEFLTGDEPATIFFPTNDAISKLPSGMWDKLQSDPARFAYVMYYHGVFGTFYPPGLHDGQIFRTVNRLNVTMHVSKEASGGTKISVNNATVIGPAIPASNGVIYIIDTLLVPPSPRAKLSSV